MRYTETNLKVSQQKYSRSDSNVIVGKFGHFVFNVEKPENMQTL